jgi:O-methyltransferase involved in polyketide biosynthesis
MGAEDARITPTAHYTGQVWVEHGLSDPALGTALGAVFHAALRPMNLAWEHLTSEPNLDMMLLARHRTLDALLERAVVEGRVGQVIELAAGLSGRGCRFTRRFPDLRYVETDLPDMAARKARTLDDAGLRGPGHEVVALDALTPGGLSALAARLDPGRGTAIVTEGLVGYFAREVVEGLWARIAAVLRAFPHGVYLSDLNLGGDARGMRHAAVFVGLLSLFARGQVHLHYRSAEAAAAALRGAGFPDVRLWLPEEVLGTDAPGYGRRHLVRLVEARVA